MICVETARTDTVLPWWVPDNNIRLRGTGYGTSIDENKPMRVSSSDSPRSLEFRVDGGQAVSYFLVNSCREQLSRAGTEIDQHGEGAQVSRYPARRCERSG